MSNVTETKYAHYLTLNFATLIIAIFDTMWRRWRAYVFPMAGFVAFLIVYRPAYFVISDSFGLPVHIRPLFGILPVFVAFSLTTLACCRAVLEDSPRIGPMTIGRVEIRFVVILTALMFLFLTVAGRAAAFYVVLNTMRFDTPRDDLTWLLLRQNMMLFLPLAVLGGLYLATRFGPAVAALASGAPGSLYRHLGDSWVSTRKQQWRLFAVTVAFTGGMTLAWIFLIYPLIRWLPWQGPADYVLTTLFQAAGIAIFSTYFAILFRHYSGRTLPKRTFGARVPASRRGFRRQ